MKRFDKLERMCEAFDSYQYDTTGTMKNEDTLQDVFDGIEDVLNKGTGGAGDYRGGMKHDADGNMMLTLPDADGNYIIQTDDGGEAVVNDQTVQIDLQDKEECPCGDAMAFALNLSAQLKLWHWQTSTHTTHEILGDMYDKVDEELDKFVELVVGAYGICAEDYVVAELEPFQSKAQVIATIESWIENLSDPSSVFSDNTDIASVRDNIMGILRRGVYLLNME